MEREEFQKALEKFAKVRDKNYKASDTMLAASAEVPNSSSQTRVERPQSEDKPSNIDEKALCAAVSEGARGSTQRSVREAPVGKAFIGSNALWFWERLERVVAQQLPEEDAKTFCSSFQSAHKELVEYRLSLDAIERIVERWGGGPGTSTPRRARDDEVEEPP